MNFIFASDSFKGSLTSYQIADILEESAKCVFPECTCVKIPMADGGEGTLEAVLHARGGSLKKVLVHGPLMEEVWSSYGVFGSSHAVIEMAAASGLPMVPHQLRNPLHTTTYGTGELILDALVSGYRNITIAIGGSATNDGGMGAMSALGIRFLDEKGNLLTGYGIDLGQVCRIDVSGLHRAAANAEFTVMCDVNNPLTGPRGATYTFGPQKGGTPQILDQMEDGMKQYAKILSQFSDIDVNQVPGSGAAGGLGAALCTFLHAKMKSGIETVLDLLDFDTLLENADLVVTGEGRLDGQSAFGKVPGGIGMRCKAKKVGAIAIVGSLGEGADKIYEYGIDSVVTSIQSPMSVEEAMERAEELYKSAALRTFRMLKAGIEMKR